MSFNIGSVSADITADNSKFIKAFNDSGKAVDRLEGDLKKAKKSTKGFSDSLSRISDFVIGGVLADGISRLADSVFDLGGAFIQNGVDYEQTQIAFETMLGSAEAGQKMLKDLSDFAVNTPFEIPQLEDTAKNLLAMGFSVEEVLPTVQMLGDISSGVGTNKLPFLTLALSQVRTAGKLTGNELRQFSENGVPLLELLADKAGVSMAEMRENITNGLVPFEDVQEVLMDTTQEGGKFFDLMDRQSQTLGGKWSNMVDEIVVKGREIFEALKPVFHQLLDGLKPALDGVLNSVVPLVNFLIKNKDILIASMLGISSAILYAVVPALIAKATAWWGVASAMWASGVIPAVLAVAAAVALLYLAIKWIWESNFLGIQEIVGGFVGVIQELWGVLMTNLMPVLNDFWNIMKNLWNTFVTAITPALLSLQAELQRLWDVIQPILIPILQELKTVLIDVIKHTIETQIKPALAFLQNLFEAVLPYAIVIFNAHLEMIQTIIGLVADFIQAKGSQIQNIFKNLFQLIGNLIKGDFSAAWENMKNIMESIGDLDLETLGRNLMQGFINGITSMSGAVMDAAKGIASSAKNAITDALQINSPSRFGIWVGQMTGDGLIGGLDKSKEGVGESAEKLTNSLKSGILHQAIATPTNNLQTINNQKSVSNNNTNNFNISGAQNPMNIAQIIDQRIANSNRNNRLNSNNAYA